LLRWSGKRKHGRVCPAERLGELRLALEAPKRVSAKLGRANILAATLNTEVSRRTGKRLLGSGELEAVIA
jgi:hypothetical protein